MRYLTLAVILLGVTGTMAAFRCFSWQPADAARAPDRAAKVDPAGRAAIDGRPGPEGAALDFVPVTADDGKDSGEKLYARLAADCAQHLYEKAKKQPDNVRLLRQAAAHYRACLSHEPPTDAGALFVEARKNLAQIDTLLTAAQERQTQRPAPVVAPKLVEKPAVREQPAPVAPPVTTSKEEGLMVGPDGTVFRKER